METLPPEIIERIICSENLSVVDIVNFSLTNRYNNLFVTNSNIIWKKKYFETWPQFVELFNNKFNYYAEVQYIYDLKRRTREILSMMPSRFFKVQISVLSKSDFAEWFELYHEKPQTYYYLIDDLINIANTDVPIQSIEVVPITTPGNKTLQHYAMKVLRYLRQLHLAKEWRTFIALPQKLQTLEKGMVFVGEWFQPNSVSWMNIATELDKMAEKVKEDLRIEQPNHPLFRVPKEQLEIWKNENIEGDKYDLLHCTQIIPVLTHGIRKWRFDPSDNIRSTVKILEEIIGCKAANFIYIIIYESVGRRLGVKFEPIVHSSQFYLRSLKSNDPQEHQYICFSYNCYCDLLIEDETIDLPVFTTQQVVKLLAAQVGSRSIPFPSNWLAAERLCSRLEFFDLVSPFNVSLKHDLSSLYMHYNMDTTSYIEVLMQQKNQAPEQIERIINVLQQYQTDRNHGSRLFRQVESKVRPRNLKYAVGMVMERWFENIFYMQMCIICDWDPVCLASDVKPVYRVLLEDGSYQFLAQDELKVPCSSPDFRAWGFIDIGCHFSHRFEAVFVPNADKEREYPADTAVRNMYNEKLKPLL